MLCTRCATRSAVERPHAGYPDAAIPRHGLDGSGHATYRDVQLAPCVARIDGSPSARSTVAPQGDKFRTRRTISVVSVARAMSLAALVSALTGVAFATQDGVPGHRTGKAAAHAALMDGANLPANPAALPDLASQPARGAVDETGTSRKSDSARDTQNQVEQHAVDNARLSHDEAADQTAQTSITGAVRSAAADSRAAAAQVRSNSAKAKGPAKPATIYLLTPRQ